MKKRKPVPPEILRDRSNRWFPLTALGFVLLYLFPFGISLFYLFFTPDGKGGFRFVNGPALTFVNPVFQMAAGNTLLSLAGYVSLSLLLSVLAAFLLEHFHHRHPTAALLVSLTVIVPYIIPSGVTAVWLESIFGASGAINAWLYRNGGAPVNFFDSAFTPLMLLVLYLWKYSGLNIFLLTTACRQIPHDSLESARIEGAGEWIILRKIVLPQLGRHMLFAFLLSVLNFFRLSGDIYILYGSYPPVQAYFLQNYLTNTMQKMEFYKTVSASLIFLLLAVGIACFYLSRQRKREQ